MSTTFDGLTEAEAKEFASRWLPAWTGNDARVLEYGDDEVSGRSPVLDAVSTEGLVVHGSLGWLRRRLRRERARA